MADYRRRAIIASEGGGGTIAPDFSTATWAEIQAYINENGTADYAEQVGKTRPVTLSDSSEHTLRLANATGDLYELADGSGSTGFIVEFVDCIQNSKWATNSSNVGAFDSIDPMGTTTLPAIKALLPQDLQDILAIVKVVKSTGGGDSTLVSSDMDLFLPALKEIGGNARAVGYSFTEENNALTWWAWHEANDSDYNSRCKKLNGQAVSWWTRSSYSSGSQMVCFINEYGNMSQGSASSSLSVCPCFCLAKQPPTPPDFSTDSWSDIQAYIDEYGTNGFADQVGATRDITLSDNTTNTLRLANATGNLYELADGSGYTGFVVEFLKYTQNTYFSSSASNVGALGTFDPISTTVLPAIKAKLPQDLRDIIATVKVLKANSTTDTTLVSSDMDLFLPAVYELTGKTWWGPATESQFTLWKYYEIHNTESDRGKDVSPSAGYWTRTTSRQTNNQMMDNISISGYIGDSFVNQIQRAAVPCFCLAPTPPAPTPTSFADDDWATIKYAVDNNLASAVYSVGDTKTITLSDSSTHTLRIANITGNLYEYADNAGTYTGFVVEFADCVKVEVFANTDTNVGALADFDPMGTTTLPTIQASLPSDLQSLLTNVKVIRANSGSSGTLVSSNMKLFIPAVKEIFGNVSGYGRPEERSALTQWAYYSEHTSATDRQKKYYSAYYDWWLRTGYSGTTAFCTSDQSGNIGAVLATRTGVGISPCFCI